MNFVKSSHCGCVLTAQPKVIDPPSRQTLPLVANTTFTCRTIGRVQWEISDKYWSIAGSDSVTVWGN